MADSNKPQAAEVGARPTLTGLALQRDYVNSYQIAFTANDIQILFNFNSFPERLLIMSFGMAKELATDLGKAMEAFERDVAGGALLSPRDAAKKMASTSATSDSSMKKRS